MSLEQVFTLGRFRTKVIIHVILITGIALAGALLAIDGQSFLTLTFVGIVLLYAITSLFSLVNRTNRDLTNFLLSIRFDDFETTYTQRKNATEDKATLYNAFNLITGKFRDIRSEKEAQHQFLLALVEQVETGLICFDQDGQTIMMNHALKKLLHKSYLPKLDSLRKIDEHLHQTLMDFQPGERILLKVKIDDELLQLAIIGTMIIMNEQTIRLFSFQNISSELNQQEMESWHKLIRILTHEIMNSVSPVVSLAATTDEIINQAQGMDEDVRADIHHAIHAIQKRGESLLSFTSKYRELTRIPSPEIEELDLKALLQRIAILHKAELEQKEISLRQQMPQHDVMIKGDPGLLEQAFINLFKNAIESLDGHQNPILDIRLHKEGSESVIQIADTGDGIDEDMLDQIFIPFFTTKKEGSGIGLSLCRQIILMHHGSINVNSELGKGTVFTVRL